MTKYSKMTPEERALRNRQSYERWYLKLSPEERSALSKKKRELRKERYGKDYNAYPNWRKKVWPKPLCQAHTNSVAKKYPDALVEDFSLDDFIVWVKENYSNTCHYCGRDGHHIDHIIPLSKGGKHEAENLQMLCKNCNLGKNNFLPEEFEEYVQALVKHQTHLNAF